jgi:hypothetical protein
MTNLVPRIDARPPWWTRSAAVLACAVTMCLAPTASFADFLYVADEQPQQIDVDLWRFTLPVGVRPAGALQFASVEFDFASLTQGVEVSYDFNGRRTDYVDGREFLSVSPTLFNQRDGFIHGWQLSDLHDGVFSGVVRATAPLTGVYFTIEADQLVPTARAPRRSPVVSGSLTVVRRVRVR